MKKTVICTTCPSGCEMEAIFENEKDLKVTGNRCKRGEAYCRSECFNPKRTFAASVKIEGSRRAVMPVRSKEPVPKELIMNCADEVHKIKLKAPVRCHDVILKNAAGSGVDIIASMTIDREE